MRNEGNHDRPVVLEELTTLAANPCKRKVISLVQYHFYQNFASPINRLYISLLIRFMNFLLLLTYITLKWMEKIKNVVTNTPCN